MEWTESALLLRVDNDDCIVDDYLSQRINELNVQENIYTYNCISCDDIQLLNEICEDKECPVPSYIYPSPNRNWAYIEEAKEGVYQDNAWRYTHSEPNYLPLLNSYEIPYVIVNDCCNKLTAHEHIRTQYKTKYRSDIKTVLRSSWEANVGRTLDYLGVIWGYEREFFELSNDLTYLPDFFIGSNTILEVKGFWDADSRKKVSTFQKEYPEWKLLILDADMYFTLRRKYKDIVPNWEDDGEKSVISEIIPIVGMRHCASTDTVKSLLIGDTVLFKREPDNEYDHNAIKATTIHGESIGYVGSDWTFIYASKMDIGMKYSATVVEKAANTIEVRIVRTNADEVIIFDFLNN
jgi:hypothetical protein